MYNVETVGSNRGPNAILFGSGAAGGVMNLLYYGNAKSVFDAMVAYRARGLFGWNKEKLAVTYQLNVVNLLDDSHDLHLENADRHYHGPALHGSRHAGGSPV